MPVDFDHLDDGLPLWLWMLQVGGFLVLLSAIPPLTSTLGSDPLVLLAVLAGGVALEVLPRASTTFQEFGVVRRALGAVCVAGLVLGAAAWANQLLLAPQTRQIVARVEERPARYERIHWRHGKIVPTRVTLAWGDETHEVRVRAEEWRSVRRGGRAAVELRQGVLGFWVVQSVRGL